MIKIIVNFIVVGLVPLLQAGVQVAAFHPLVADWAREIGGNKVTVIDMAKDAQNLHQFEPGAKHLLALEKSDLWVFSGKGFETYAADLSQQLKPNQEALDLGKYVPSRKLSDEELKFACCDIHSNIAVDPHWWHRVNYVERAIKVLSKKLQKIDAANADYYKSNAKAYFNKLDELDQWIKLQVAQIPKNQRYLATDHAAFGYLCDQYGFKPLFLKGMTPENKIASKHLLKHVEILKKYKIKAIFNEELSNPKMLQQIAKETGAQIGGNLIADGRTDAKIPTYVAMMRHNISTIKQGLLR